MSVTMGEVDDLIAFHWFAPPPHICLKPALLGTYPCADAFGRSWPSIGALGVSCALGVGMSYFAFLCRSQVSATHFTVIGNVCKVLTVLINICIWDKHATPAGVAFLLLCLTAAFFYKPSPLRMVPMPPEEEQGLVEKTEEASVPPISTPTKA